MQMRDGFFIPVYIHFLSSKNTGAKEHEFFDDHHEVQVVQVDGSGIF